MAEANEKRQAEDEPVESSAATQSRPEGGELTDEQLDKVSGGQATDGISVSNVLKVRHDTAKNMIGNIR